jgi:hypothetical protein
MAKLPTPHPQSHTVFPAMSPSSLTHPSIFCIVMSCPFRMSSCTVLTSSESEYILFHRLKPSLLKYSRTSVLSSAEAERAVVVADVVVVVVVVLTPPTATAAGRDGDAEKATAVRAAMAKVAAEAAAKAPEIFIVGRRSAG